jgi:hypothetical protein
MYKLLDKSYRLVGEMNDKTLVDEIKGVVKYTLGYIDFNFLKKKSNKVLGNLINIPLDIYIEEPTDEGFRLYKLDSIDYMSTVNQGINIGVKDMVVSLKEFTDSNLTREAL